MTSLFPYFNLHPNFGSTSEGSPFRRQLREWAFQVRSSEELPSEWAGYWQGPPWHWPLHVVPFWPVEQIPASRLRGTKHPQGLTLTPQPLNATDGQKSNCLLEFLCNSPGKTCDLSGNSSFSNIHFFAFGYQTLVTGTKTTLCFPRDIYHPFG